MLTLVYSLAALSAYTPEQLAMSAVQHLFSFVMPKPRHSEYFGHLLRSHQLLLKSRQPPRGQRLECNNAMTVATLKHLEMLAPKVQNAV